MDNTRLFLWLALLAMLWLNYDAWLRDRVPAQTSRIPPPAELDRANDDVPDIGAPSVDAPASASPAAESRALAMRSEERRGGMKVCSQWMAMYYWRHSSWPESR